MSDTIKIKVEVNGKSVPLSDISMETIGKIRDAESEESAPVFSTTKKKGRNILIIKLTEICKDNLRSAINGDSTPYVALGEDGDWDWGFYSGDAFIDVKRHYSESIKPLFGESK